MSILAVFLIATGLTDLLRGIDGRRWPPVLAAPLLVVLCAALCALTHPGDLLPVATAATGAALWELSIPAESDRSGRNVLPLSIFGASILVLLLLSGLAAPVGGLVASWWAWSALGPSADATRMTMAVGAGLLQLGTGNRLVRLLLATVGAVKPPGQPQPSDRLKGGRLLGPMERLLIVGLSLAGQLTVATALVAAKSIIRFPEINAQRANQDGVGIDDVTEYFLIGSFASWTVALGGGALVAAS